MTGAVMGPFEAYLVLRGLKTMDVRMERHNANAMRVAEWLEACDKVEKVYYPRPRLLRRARAGGKADVRLRRHAQL